MRIINYVFVKTLHMLSPKIKLEKNYYTFHKKNYSNKVGSDGHRLIQYQCISFALTINNCLLFYLLKGCLSLEEIF